MVITLDAAAMNELVSNERGLLVPRQPHGKSKIAMLWHAEAAAMETVIERAIAISEHERETIGT